MGIKRYIAKKDNTITNAFEPDLLTRGTGSNMGESDVLEVFSIYGHASSASAELSRILIEFPVNDVKTDRTAGTIPASGSVNFYLKMSNAKHSSTLPRGFTLEVAALSQSWEEGTGLDMEEYSDLTHDGTGSNWLMRGSGSSWGTIGGKFHPSPKFKQTFERGHEDLEIDITHLVENWIDGITSGGSGDGASGDSRKLNYGVGVYLTASQEAKTERVANALIQNKTGSAQSFYTKKFFGRGSEFFFKRPCIEARWDSSIKDEAGTFNLWSPLAEDPSGDTRSDNINTIYFYNSVNGQLKNISSTYLPNNKILVSLYSSSVDGTRPIGAKLELKSSSYDAGFKSVVTTGHTNATGGLSTTTGIYSCSLALTGTDVSGTLSNVFAVWHNKDGFVAGTSRFEFHTSSIEVSHRRASTTNSIPRYVTSAPSLRPSYHKNETARFRFYIREKNWSPNIYTKATSEAKTSVMENAYFRISRIADDHTVIDYGTGSANNEYSRLSYDVSGNYFDLDMNLLQPDYAYGINLIYYINGAYVEQPEQFKFRVEQS